MKKVLLISTGIEYYDKSELRTGLWFSEMTHIYEVVQSAGWEIVIASPNGGKIPIDPESLKCMMLDKLSKKMEHNHIFINLLMNSRTLQEVKDETFDLVYLAGGHGTMFDFPENEDLQYIIRQQFESGRTLAAICHGVCGLLNVTLADGDYLVKGKNLTGFSWLEEKFARRQKYVPFNLESELKNRGANYEKAIIPMTSNVVIDGNLITGQNPFSSKEIAKKIKKIFNII